MLVPLRPNSLLDTGVGVKHVFFLLCCFQNEYILRAVPDPKGLQKHTT